MKMWLFTGLKFTTLPTVIMIILKRDKVTIAWVFIERFLSVKMFEANNILHLSEQDLSMRERWMLIIEISQSG